jgi:hypothetical protein
LNDLGPACEGAADDVDADGVVDRFAGEPAIYGVHVLGVLGAHEQSGSQAMPGGQEATEDVFGVLSGGDVGGCLGGESRDGVAGYCSAPVEVCQI